MSAWPGSWKPGCPPDLFQSVTLGLLPFLGGADLIHTTDLFRALSGQGIGAFIAGIPGVALDPDPVDLMSTGHVIEPLPQVNILHGFAGRRFPPISFPAVDPSGQAVFDVSAIRMEAHLA